MRISATLTNSDVTAYLDITHEMYRCVLLELNANMLVNREYTVEEPSIEVDLSDVYGSADGCEKELILDAYLLDGTSKKSLPALFGFSSNSETITIESTNP